MTFQQPKQQPVSNDTIGSGMPQQQYFTADEAMDFLAPRIRAMFK